MLVPKKSTNGIKKWRMFIDYRKLNSKLIPDKHPLPRIESSMSIRWETQNILQFWAYIQDFTKLNWIKKAEN